MFGVSFLIRYNPIGFAFVFIGCVIGGLLYRFRSRQWPIDPTARSRQLRYTLAVLTLIPGTIALFFGIEAQGAAMVMIGVIAGVAITCGIMVSGTRRHQKAS